jgi:hypothetical protein
LAARPQAAQNAPSGAAIPRSFRHPNAAPNGGYLKSIWKKPW